MTGIVDYGAGNLQSVANALDRVGAPYQVCRTPEQLEVMQRIVLPGVGHFGAAARTLQDSGMAPFLQHHASADRPLLGICLGMQLLLETSDEAPGAPGLGLIPGGNRRLTTRTVPHIGWNQVQWERGDHHYYFAHSYAAAPLDPGDVLATVEQDGRTFPAVIGRGAILGLQFHPEKSGAPGLALLEEFCRC